MLEMFVTKPVFQGNDEINQLEVIYSVMGTPDAALWPGVVDTPWYELVRPKEAIAPRFKPTFSRFAATLYLAELK
jgi:CTD kinase subunit alpha